MLCWWTLETSMESSQKNRHKNKQTSQPKINLPHGPATPWPVSRGLGILLYRHTCSALPSAALVTTAGKLKQPNCPSKYEQLMRMWYVYTVAFYPTAKRINYETNWTDWEKLILKEVAQAWAGEWVEKSHILSQLYFLASNLQGEYTAWNNCRNQENMTVS